MKIYYYPQNCVTQKEVKVCNQLTRSLAMFLPFYTINKTISFIIIMMMLLLIAYTGWLIVDVFRKKEPTIDEKLAAYKRQKEIDTMNKDLESKKPKVNVNHNNLL